MIFKAALQKKILSNHFLKFSKGLVFSCENCEIFTKSFFDRKPPVTSVDLLFLTKSSVGWFLLKRLVLGHSTRYLHTILLVETIPTRFYLWTCRNQKLVQSEPLQQRLYVLILGF